MLTHANNWEELERGLARLGLTLRAKGGGFVLTDGTQEVKASDVGREFSRANLKKRLDRQSEDAAPAIEAAAPPAPVVLPATLNLPRAAAAQTIAATAGHTDRDEQHQPIRSPRTPQFGDAGHGIADLLRDTPEPQRGHSGPALERAPVLQPRAAESHAPTPAAADAVPVPAETSLGVTTAAPAMAEAPEPSQTAEPVREEVGTPLLSIHPAQSGVEPLRQEPQRQPRKRGTQKADEEQVELWSQAPAPHALGAPAAPLPTVEQHRPAVEAVENPEIVAETPLSSMPAESPREIEPLSAPESPPMMEAAAENAPAPGWPERDESAWAELSARIERLGQKPSVEFMGETLTGASSGIPASATQPQEAERTFEGAGSEEAEKFLRMATRALEGKARLSEANDAASEAFAAKDRLSGLDTAEKRVKTARTKFETQLDETLRDPGAFLGWFDQLDDPRKRELLRLLEFGRAAFAREFSAALKSGAAKATKRQFVWSSNPEKRVFVNPVGDGDLRLAALDGEWYLEKVRACRAAFREARKVFGLPKSATRAEVRKAAGAHVDVAEGREADALFQYQRLGKTPDLYELPGALRRLSASDQEWVVKQLPALAEHIKHIAQAGIDLAEGPRRKGSGIDF